MTRHCPYCGHEMPEIRLGVRLPVLKARIFDLIQRGGRDGIDRLDLLDIINTDREKPIGHRTLKSHLFQMNELIEGAGYRIVGHSVARLEKITTKENGND
jgi:hypothetical protein